ncbi:MAG TPA: NUDIX domain-containing protein [Candidatus Paceibacterota bacterium]|nr:NUDIX domain-containing protein [Candidatus Paceibacterota bacterium]
MNLYVRNLQELQRFPTVISNIFVGIILCNAKENSILVIQESDKQHSRFPGGGVEASDDYKGILSDLKQKGLLRDIGGFLNTLKHAAKRELKEELALDIDEAQLTFVCGLLTEDQEGEGRHLKVFLKYPLPENFVPSLDVPSVEAERLIDFHFIKTTYDPARQFLHLDPFLLLSRDHFYALLQGAKNGKL